MVHRLICHPDTPARGVEHVSVQISRVVDGSGVWLEFHVRPADQIRLPEFAVPERADGLWRTTCFELFTKPVGDEAYCEFNFSPSFQWAAYGFDGYRVGMRALDVRNPEISVTPGAHFFLSVEAFPPLPTAALSLALSAVIEETDGTRSYWALRHPPGPPDFHHPDCFALELPALGRA